MNINYFPVNPNKSRTLQVIIPRMQIIIVIVDHILTGSNIFLHYETGPHKNKEESKDKMVPNEYIIEN